MASIRAIQEMIEILLPKSSSLSIATRRCPTTRVFPKSMHSCIRWRICMLSLSIRDHEIVWIHELLNDASVRIWRDVAGPSTVLRWQFAPVKIKRTLRKQVRRQGDDARACLDSRIKQHHIYTSLVSCCRLMHRVRSFPYTSVLRRLFENSCATCVQMCRTGRLYVGRAVSFRPSHGRHLYRATW